jgi:hypothetical protein
MRHDIFEERVPLSGAQQIWRCNKRAGCNHLSFLDRHKDCNVFMRQDFRPNLFRSVYRFDRRTYFRESKEFKELDEVGTLRKSGIGHPVAPFANVSQSNCSTKMLAIELPKSVDCVRPKGVIRINPI